VITVLLAGLIVVVIYYGATRPPEEIVPQEKRLANVEALTIRARSYREALVLPAVVEAERVAGVSPEFDGKLARWLAGEGELVKQGQVVADLDTAALRARLKELEAQRKSATLAVDRARAALDGSEARLANARKDAEVQQLGRQSAEADLELARTDFDRAQSLVEKRVMDTATLDKARNTLTQAEIAVDRAKESIARADLAVRAAEAQLQEARTGIALAGSSIEELDAATDSLKVQIGKARLRAPIAGRIEEHLVEPGEVVAAGIVIARIYDLDHLCAVVSVPDRYVAFLDEGNPAVAEYVRLNRPGALQAVRASLIVPGLPKLTGGESPGLDLPAEITRIAQASDSESNTFKVELRFENPGGALKHGVIARGRIEYLTYPDAIVIPMKAVQVSDVGPRVMVVERIGGANIARTRDIVPASIREAELLVLDGLRPGERLIVAGWKGLVEGEEVNVIVEDGIFVAAGGDEE
jgi:RND family efflux transporter MFP subunit